MRPREKGSQAEEASPVLCAWLNAKTQRSKESRIIWCNARSGTPLIVTPLRLPGEEKGLGDEVGEHAQFVFCELH